MKLNKCKICKRSDTELTTVNLTPERGDYSGLIVICRECRKNIDLKEPKK